MSRPRCSCVVRAKENRLLLEQHLPVIHKAVLHHTSIYASVNWLKETHIGAYLLSNYPNLRYNTVKDWYEPSSKILKPSKLRNLERIVREDGSEDGEEDKHVEGIEATPILFEYHRHVQGAPGAVVQVRVRHGPRCTRRGCR